MGAFEEVKGKVKQAVGDVTDDFGLEREGRAQEEKGEAGRGATEARAETKGRAGEAAARALQQRAAQETK